MLRDFKRPDLLIEIAHRAPDIRFVVCGGVTIYKSPPNFETRIVDELRSTPNIEYLGQVAPKKAQQVIADAAVLLSTSDEEGFPNIFTQAWSSGTPVVSLKIDPDRIIQRVKLGAISGSVERAVTDIKDLMKLPQLREEIAARARHFIKEKHSGPAVVKSFEQDLQCCRKSSELLNALSE